MHKNTDFIYEAIGKLEELSKMPIKIQSSRELFDVILDIQGTQFYVIAKKNAKNYTYGLILTDLNKVDSSKNVLFIADHISGKLAKQDRKSTRLNSSHVAISYAVFCLN